MKTPQTPVRSTMALLTSLLAGWGCVGCAPQAPPSKIGCYLPRPRDLARIKRVVLVELSYDGDCAALPGDMTQALAKAVQDRVLFHVDVVGAEDPQLRDLALRALGPKTIRDLGDLRRAFATDAVLIGAVRHYEPYPRMQIGLYLQLLDLKAGRLVWALDHTWDTSDRATQARIRQFFNSRLGQDYGPLDWRLATVSPRLFHRYVAREVADTLSLEPASPPAPRRSPYQAVAGAVKKTFDY